jgi:hypothetical protein
MLNAMRRFEELPMDQKAAVLNRIVLYPASNVATLVRHDMGARLVSQNVGLCSLGLFFLSAFMFPTLDRLALRIFAGLILVSGMEQRFKRWREFGKGIRTHSYSLGSSIFNRARLPAFFKRNRRIESTIDPGLFVVIGFFMHSYTPILGGWLIISGVCLFVTEVAVQHRELNEKQDLVDGMVKSEIQTETVDQFAGAAPAQLRAQAAGSGLSTGIGADIAHKIKRRR